MPHVRPATSAGTRRGANVTVAGPEGCCAGTTGSWKRWGELADMTHPLPRAGSAIAHAHAKSVKLALGFGSVLVVALFDGFF